MFLVNVFSMHMQQMRKKKDFTLRTHGYMSFLLYDNIIGYVYLTTQKVTSSAIWDVWLVTCENMNEPIKNN